MLVDGRIAGILDRNSSPCVCQISVPPGGAQLEILVENMGRINYGNEMEHERKGITGAGFLAYLHLFGWEVWPLPLEDLSRMSFRSLNGAPPPVPAFFRGCFTVEDEPCDTFLAVPGGGRGSLFLNGVNLGRYWQIGPQRTLYVPAPLLRRGENEIILFETQGLGETMVRSQAQRDFGPCVKMQI